MSKKVRFEGLGLRPLEYRKVAFRNPRKGEYYLSGAIVQAYRAPNDLSSPYQVVAPVQEAPPLREYTFDMQLDGSITVKAASGAEALKMIRAAFERETMCIRVAPHEIHPQTFRAKLADRDNVVTLRDWSGFKEESRND